MEKIILHADLNNFYASVACLYQPEIRSFPVAVGGDQELRHGIVLAKNELAKKYGVKTGEPLWQAKRKCPNLQVVPPNQKQYLYFSRLARDIYADYTDFIESFGIDEAWLDVSASTNLYGNGQKIADTIRQRMKEELGLTCSIGISYNKVFAKLGSDYKKPDATTLIDKNNYKKIAWPLPVDALLYVGPATCKKLALFNIHTIGQLAQANLSILKQNFGKSGETIWNFANGLDQSPVRNIHLEQTIKSVGNSVTTPRDLQNLQDVEIVFTLLAQSIAARLREHNLKSNVVQISIRNNQLLTINRQATLPYPTFLAQDFAMRALSIFQKTYQWQYPIRSLGLRATNLQTGKQAQQMTLFEQQEEQIKQENLAHTLDILHRRFGENCIKPAVLYQDPTLSNRIMQEEQIGSIL